VSAAANLLVVSAASLAVLVVVQAAAFAVGRRIGRVNVVDVAWGIGFVLVAFVAAVLGDGDAGRRWLLFVLVAVWGARLSIHMHRKSAGKGEDPRYRDLLERAGGASTATVVLRVFAIQGAAQWFVSLPLQVSAVLGATRGFAAVAVAAGLVLWVVGLTFEAVGDRQMLRFTRDPANRGRIMDRGLWGWTRHPNYFGDACLWWGLWLICASVWPGVLTVASPILMTYFLVYATGARLLEKSMAVRPGYREYQARTAFFVPRPPRG
jgi:steroid 5-alpha reductase family enzyme